MPATIDDASSLSVIGETLQRAGYPKNKNASSAS
jgi:hypothetical protein